MPAPCFGRWRPPISARSAGRSHWDTRQGAALVARGARAAARTETGGRSDRNTHARLRVRPSGTAAAAPSDGASASPAHGPSRLPGRNHPLAPFHPTQPLVSEGPREAVDRPPRAVRSLPIPNGPPAPVPASMVRREPSAKVVIDSSSPISPYPADRRGQRPPARGWFAKGAATAAAAPLPASGRPDERGPTNPRAPAPAGVRPGPCANQTHGERSSAGPPRRARAGAGDRAGSCPGHSAPRGRRPRTWTPGRRRPDGG